MAQIYYLLIKNNENTGMTIDMVPASLKEKVQALLDADKLDGTGKPVGE